MTRNLGAKYLLRMNSRASEGGDPRHEGQVVVDERDAIATVQFSHPKSNSLPGALLREIADEIAKLAANSGLKVIVLRSEGDGVFCAGASFDEMKAVNDAASGREFFSGFGRVMLAMMRAPQFVVTRVQGKVLGGGVGLLAASDYVVATAGASLKLSELAVGLGPFVIGPAVERRIGRGPFAALAIDADWRDAAWAERHGLYARVCESAEDMDDVIAKLLEFLSSANPEAIKQLKQTFATDTSDWDQLLERRAAISGALALSAHTRAAIEKFEKK
jgi:methylglutaconyl-CoA hydratase